MSLQGPTITKTELGNASLLLQEVPYAVTTFDALVLVKFCIQQTAVPEGTIWGNSLLRDIRRTLFGVKECNSAQVSLKLLAAVGENDAQ